MNLINVLRQIFIGIVIGILLSVVPALAQSDFDFSPSPVVFDSWQIFQSSSPETDKVPVVVDGKELFQISPSAQHTATERVKLIQERLQPAIRSGHPPEIEIEERNQLPVLYLNGEYLLTVTRQDTIVRETPGERAELWAGTIEQAIIKAQLERTPQYLKQQLIIASLTILFAILLSRLLTQLQQYPLRQALARVIPGITKSSQPASNLTILFRFKLGLVQLALWLVTILILIGLFPFSRQWQYQTLYLLKASFTTSLLTVGDTTYSLLDLLLFVALFGGLLFGTGMINQMLRTRVLQATRMNLGSQEVISIVVRYVLLFLGSIVLLQAWGINLSSLALIGSVLGVGIGFGLQDIAKNFASGLVLLFERSIKVGDFIEIDQHIGTVERVGARSIVLKTLDRVSIIVPNSRLLAEEVINWSHGNPASRIHVPVGVAYGSDAQKVKAALLQAAQEHPEVLRHPQPQVFFTSFGDSSLDFELLVWTSDPSRQQPLISDLYFRIEEILRQQEIKIPFPQRDLHLRTGNLPLTISPQLESSLMKFLNQIAYGKSRNSHHSSKNYNS